MTEPTNTAAKVWRVIEDNRGTADVHSTYANAVPAGVDPIQLTGAQGPASVSWRWDEGLVLKDFTLDLTVQWYHSARYKQGGAWIPSAVVIPALSLGWMGGYNITVTCTADPPFNAGSDTAPIAVLPLRLEMHWTNWLWSHSDTAALQLRGDGGAYWHVDEGNDTTTYSG